jgi:hypothetical protein
MTNDEIKSLYLAIERDWLEADWAIDAEDHYQDAIESFELAAMPKVHGGEETNPRAIRLDRKEYMAVILKQECGIKGEKPRHKSWKECCKWGKRWGDRLDKREAVCLTTI